MASIYLSYTSPAAPALSQIAAGANVMAAFHRGHIFVMAVQRNVQWLPNPRAVLFACAASILLCACNLSDSGPVALGTLEWDRVELLAEVAEPVIAIYADQGKQVTAGQTILQLDARRTEARLQQARAARQQAAARLAELQRGPRPELIAESRAKVAGAESRLGEAKADLKRQQGLVAKKFVSPENLDRATMQRDTSYADWLAATEALRALEAGTTSEELEQAESALGQADATVKELEISLGKLTVTAPVGGRLDSLPYKLGTQVPQGAVVAVMLSGDAPYARVYVPEPQRLRMTPGREYEVLIDGADTGYKGVVRHVASDPAFTPYFALTERDRTRLSYVAEITLTEAKAQELPAGLPVQVPLPTGE